MSQGGASAPLVVGRHDGYTYSIFDSRCRPPLAELEALANDAWAADYDVSNRPVFRYDKDYLRWLMPEGHFFLTWAIAADGRPAGCVLHIERDFCCRGRWFKACYGTLLSVSRRHRGRHVAERLMHHAFDWAFDVRGADLEMGVFDLGQSGQPAITRSVQTYGRGHDPVKTAPIRVWAAMADIAKAVRYDPPEGIARIAAWPGVRRLFEFHASPDDLAVTPVPPAPPDRDRVANACTMAFGWTASVPIMYAGSGPSGGTLGFSFGPNERCAIAYHVTTLMKSGEPDTKLGVIQFIDRDTASTASAVRALRHVTARLLASGCLSVLALETGILPRQALLRARYFPTPRKISFHVAGPRERLDQMGPPDGPYFLDLC